MKDIIVKKSELLTKLEANRAAHRGIFEEALEGYKAEGIKQLENHIDLIRRGRVRAIHVVLPVPEDHTEDYDRVIAMLEMSVEDEVTLSEEDFAIYVMDQWRWKNAFITTNSAYSATARLQSPS